MNVNVLADALTNVNDKYICEAAEYTHRKLSTLRWITAACLLLILTVSIPVISRMNISSDKNDPLEMQMIDFNNAYHEVVQDKSVLKRLGINGDADKSMIGDHITYLVKEYPNDVKSQYIATSEITDLELFYYKENPCKAISILRDNDKYFWVVFCSYHTKSNESMPFEEILKVYNINGPDDIASISELKTGWFEHEGKDITDRKTISRFYNALISLKAYSNDEFQSVTFSDESTHIQYADSMRYLIIKTKSGISFKLPYNVQYGWVEGKATLSYYKMTNEIESLLDSNF